MTSSSTLPRNLWSHYDLDDRLAEVLFALASMLVFTLAVERLVTTTAEGVHALLVSTVSYSLAWAVFVGVMYVVHALSRRGRIARFAQAYRIRPDEARALNAIGHELESTLASLTNSHMRERLHWQILSNIAMMEPDDVRMKAHDLLGAIASFILVFAATIPAMIPFLFCSDAWAAVRFSNLVIIALLFACSYLWAGNTRMRPLSAANLFAALGLGVVWISLNFA